MSILCSTNLLSKNIYLSIEIISYCQLHRRPARPYPMARAPAGLVARSYPDEAVETAGRRRRSRSRAAKSRNSGPVARSASAASISASAIARAWVAVSSSAVPRVRLSAPGLRLTRTKKVRVSPAPILSPKAGRVWSMTMSGPPTRSRRCAGNPRWTRRERIGPREPPRVSWSPARIAPQLPAATSAARAVRSPTRKSPCRAA